MNETLQCEKCGTMDGDFSVYYSDELGKTVNICLDCYYSNKELGND